MKLFLVTGCKYIIGLVGVAGALAGIGSFILDCYDKPNVIFCKCFIVHAEAPTNVTNTNNTEDIFKEPQNLQITSSSVVSATDTDIFWKTKPNQ